MAATHRAPVRAGMFIFISGGLSQGTVMFTYDDSADRQLANYQSLGDRSGVMREKSKIGQYKRLDMTKISSAINDRAFAEVLELYKYKYKYKM
jgi:hypothetical protein